MSHKYTPEQRGEAVAAVQATATIESARELLAESLAESRSLNNIVNEIAKRWEKAVGG